MRRYYCAPHGCWMRQIESDLIIRMRRGRFSVSHALPARIQGPQFQITMLSAVCTPCTQKWSERQKQTAQTCSRRAQHHRTDFMWFHVVTVRRCHTLFEHRQTTQRFVATFCNQLSRVPRWCQKTKIKVECRTRIGAPAIRSSKAVPKTSAVQRTRALVQCRKTKSYSMTSDFCDVPVKKK